MEARRQPHMLSSEPLVSLVGASFSIDLNSPRRLNGLAVVQRGSFCLRFSGAGIKRVQHVTVPSVLGCELQSSCLQGQHVTGEVVRPAS